MKTDDYGNEMKIGDTVFDANGTRGYAVKHTDGGGKIHLKWPYKVFIMRPFKVEGGTSNQTLM